MTLRRSYEEIEMSNVTTRSRSKNGIRARKNAESPLLRLPLELKTRIYEFVCGGQTLHIDWSKRGFSHHLCAATLSEEAAQEKFDTSEAVWCAPEMADRHMRCCTHTTIVYDCPTCTYYPNSSRPRTETLGINVLRCCRQMYLESKFILYYANTFSFRSATLLSQFCRQIPEQYRNVIRSLHVDMFLFIGGYYIPQDWKMAFETVTSSLRGMKRLYINIELYPCEPSQRQDDQPGVEKLLLSHILQAGKLDLKIATVVLWDSHFTHEWSDDERDAREMRERWTLAQKQEWSRYLRKALLHHGDRDTELAKLQREAEEQGRICRL